MTDVLSNIPCELGESALWDPAESRFYWVDIIGQVVFGYDWMSRRTLRLPMPEPVGCVALLASFHGCSRWTQG